MLSRLILELRQFNEENEYCKSIADMLKKDGKEDTADVYFATASTPALDRDREVLIPRGVRLTNFMNNPVLLDIHNYRSVSVGRVLNVTVADDSINFAFRFANTPRGQELRQLYDDGDMSTFSVGFIPEKIVPIDDETPDELTLDINDPAPLGEHATGKGKGPYKYKLDLKKYKTRPRAVISEWELLEISPVPVPSNPEALLIRGTGHIMRKYVNSPNYSMAKGLLDNSVSEILEKFFKSLEEFNLCGPVPPHTLTLDNETPWDKAEAMNQIARWASSDGTGSKETLDFVKFALGFGWFDSDNPEKLTSYKLPHHLVVDGKLVVSWRGLTLAMSQLLGNKVNVNGENKEVYEHLARHYRDAGQEPPAFENSYSEEEIEKIVAQEFKKEGEPTDTDDGDDAGTHQVATFDATELTKVFSDFMTELQKTLKEHSESQSVRSSMVYEMLEEMHEDIRSLITTAGAPAGQNNGNEELEDGDDTGSVQLSNASSLLKQHLGKEEVTH